ncbi:MAG: DegT/DnrJ/EryC1/StrS family aminotransferase, partial [Spirochaetia bacterium]
ALKALSITGEVITTPYSFVATAHSLLWNNVKPVFVDVDPLTLNLDPSKIEGAITQHTTGILPVHVYGTVCDVAQIKSVADRHGLKVIYDAAHAFGVEKDGKSILRYGDLSILSFHATKTFSTIEGGAIVSHTLEMKNKIDHLKNFGFIDEVTVTEAGMNAKLNEFQSAYGLLSLKHFDKAQGVRKKVSEFYRHSLQSVPGVACLQDAAGVTSNYTYFPIFIDKEKYGHSRDELYERLKAHNIYARRYFYPLISEFPPYRDLPSAARINLPVAAAAADRVICLPMHGELTDDDAKRIVGLIEWF